MQVQSIDGASERKTLIWAITNKQFISRVVHKLDKDPFRSKWSNLVWSWCVKHYEKFQTNTSKEIIHYFEKWARSNKDKELYALVDKFLSSLSKEYDRTEKADLAMSLDLAEGFLNECKLERLEEEVKFKREKGHTETALQLITSFRRIDLKSTPAVSVLTDKGAQREALEAKQKTLITLPGAAGDFFNKELAEDSFVAFMAGPKGGKSFTLLHLAWLGCRQGNNVAYIQVGDLSKNQLMARFHRRANRRPIEKGTWKYPTSITVPTLARDLAVVEHEERVAEKDLIWSEAEKAFEKAKRKAKGDLRLSYHPVSTTTVGGIKNILEGWDRDNWKANVVIVDYAGNLAPEDFKLVKHEQVDRSWALLRQLSEIRKCLVVTAQQTNKEGFSSWVLTRKNFRDSLMILAHVTAFYGINRTNEEISRGVIRYNTILSREGHFPETTCLYCAACLDIANPMVASAMI